MKTGLVVVTCLILTFLTACSQAPVPTPPAASTAIPTNTPAPTAVPTKPPTATPTPTAVDATGTWSGPYNSSVSGAQSVTLHLQQNGTSLTGMYSSTAGALGSISGTVSGNTVNFTMTVTNQGCSGTLDGTGIIDVPQTGPATMNFQYDGSSTCSGQEKGTGNLTRQPTNTPDVCAGATDPGARQRFTLEQIVPCLNTAPKVSAFMANNIKRDDAWDAKNCGEICYSPAWLVYQNGVDDVHGLVTLECYFLEKNGWDAFHIGVAIETPIGTNVCGVNTNGTILVLDQDGNTEGSFTSLVEVAKYYIGHGRMKDGDKLRTIKASQITQLTTNRTTPSLIDLPWVLNPY